MGLVCEAPTIDASLEDLLPHKENFGNYILTMLMNEPCILYSLLFRPTSEQHIYINSNFSIITLEFL